MNLYLIIALSIVFASSGVPALCFYWQKRKKENKSQIKWAQKCYYFWKFVFSTKSISLIWGFFTKIISWLTNKIADILMSIAFLSVIFHILSNQEYSFEYTASYPYFHINQHKDPSAGLF